MSADGSEVGDEVESDSNGAYANSDVLIRRACCRYGSGCTHIHDTSHRERFWHPSAPKLNNEQLKSQFICNECGYASSQLKDLQSHLQRKTAWSNTSLVGCRINCLVDFKEWHEGNVLQFHKSGKHFVEFRQVNEKRWLVMKKIAFYILERPVPVSKDGHEFKDDEEEGLAPVETSYVFCEDISLDYTFAQSVLFKIYGNAIQETGHLTKGHTCLTDADRLNAQYVKGSLLYGELLPRGANKAFGADRLDTGNASVLFDLGMGTGKILIQAFLQFKNLRYIFGIELSSGRYKIAEEALLRMVRLLGEESYHVQVNPGRFIIVTEVVRVERAGSGDVDQTNNVTADKEEVEEEYIERVLHLQCGNMFDVKNIHTADIVMMETDIPADQHAKLQSLLGEMQCEARVLTYLDLRRIWQNSNALFRQLEANRHQADRYPTSWSVQRGHHFYLWSRVSSNPELPRTNSWLPQLSPNHSSPSHNPGSGTRNGNNTAAGGPTESPIIGSTRNTHTSNNINAYNASNGTPDKTRATKRWLPYRLWAYMRGNEGSNKKLTKKAISVAEYEHNLNTPGNDRAVIPLNSDGTRSSNAHDTNSNASASDQAPSAGSSVLSALQVEPLEIPTRSGGVRNGSVVGSSSAHSSVHSSAHGSVHNSGAHSAPGSGRTSPNIAAGFTSPHAHVHNTNITILSQDGDLQLPSDKLRRSKLSSKHNMLPNTTTDIHAHAPHAAHTTVTTTGTESVKLKSPRDSKKRSKARSGAESGGNNRSASVSPSTVDENPARLQLAPPVTSPTPTTAANTATPTTSFIRHANSPFDSPANKLSTSAKGNKTSSSPTTAVAESHTPSTSSAVPRSASSTHLQLSAALGAIDGMDYTNHNTSNNISDSYGAGGSNTPHALLEGGFNGDARTPSRGTTPPNGSSSSSGHGSSNAAGSNVSPSGSGKMRSTKHKPHSNTSNTTNSSTNYTATNSSTNYTATHYATNATLEASVWQHASPSRSIDSHVVQDLVSAQTITGQASAGARVLVQQTTAYESHRSQKSSILGRKKKNAEADEVVIGATSSSSSGGSGGTGKPRSYRINNTIPVRAVSNGTHAGAANNSGIVASAPPRRVDSSARSSTRDGCAIS